MSELEIIRGEANAPLEPLLERTVAVLGFGNQGSAHAMNLRDSGVNVIVGSRTSGGGAKRAMEAGFDVLSITAAVQQADLLILALPDEVQPQVYRDRIAPHLWPGQILGFLHGFAVRYRLIEPPSHAGVVMIAPKGPGATLRQRYVQGSGIPCLMAIEQQIAPTSLDAPSAQSIALAWAHGIGCARAGIIRTTFADETETDLFGEQAVLCGGMTWLMLAAFETLVEAGYPPELAYLECCHEVKQIADLVYERGMAAMMRQISNTAEFGAYAAGPALIDDATRARMKQLLQSIRDGSFAHRMTEDYRDHFKWFNEQRAAIESHGIESAGEIIRGLMPRGSSSKDRGVQQ
jgi:ketol-acid reductoisomerase